MEQAPVVLRYALRTGKRLRVEQAETLLRDVRLHLGFSHCSVGMWVTSIAAMSQHNKQLRGKSGPTDVISCPNLEFDRPLVVNKECLDIHDMGDILLCLPVVEKAALEENESLDSRFQLLVVHSMLHLVGFEHEQDEDWEKMQVEERFFAKMLGDRKYFD